jgi:protein-tyrosine phosphatase
MIKVLFVCLGNICRSPLAEAIFKHKLKINNLAHAFEVDSCGTGDYHIGEQPDKRTVKVSNKNGVEINHACRQLVADDLDYFDYLLAMDKSNYFNILRLSKTDVVNEKVKLMREFDPEHPGAEVPDPYNGGDREFQEVFAILDRSLDQFIAHLRMQHSL